MTCNHFWIVYDPDATERYFRFPGLYRFVRCRECKQVSDNPELVRIARAEAIEEFSQ